MTSLADRLSHTGHRRRRPQRVMIAAVDLLFLQQSQHQEVRVAAMATLSMLLREAARVRKLETVSESLFAGSEPPPRAAVRAVAAALGIEAPAGEVQGPKSRTRRRTPRVEAERLRSEHRRLARCYKDREERLAEEEPAVATRAAERAAAGPDRLG